MLLVRVKYEGQLSITLSDFLFGCGRGKVQHGTVSSIRICKACYANYILKVLRLSEIRIMKVFSGNVRHGVRRTTPSVLNGYSPRVTKTKQAYKVKITLNRDDSPHTYLVLRLHAD